jgi:hypothetical protein
MNLARQFLADWVGEFDWGLIERLEEDEEVDVAIVINSVNSSRSGPNSFGSSVRVRFSFSVRLAAA